MYDSGDGGFSISTQMNDLGFVLCGGLNESPCLLKLNATALPVWECDEPLAIIVPGASSQIKALQYLEEDSSKNG